MKKRAMRLVAVCGLTAAMAATAVGCGTGNNSGTSSAGEVANVSAEGETAAASVAEIDYANIPFDFADQIASEKASTVTVPEAAGIDLSAESAKGVTGVEIVSALDESDTDNYYLNAYAAGDELKFRGKDGTAVASVSSSVNGDVEVKDGAASYILPEMDAADPVDEILTVTMDNGNSYQIHTLPEAIPDITITGEGVQADDAGVYTFAVDKFLLRVNTDGKLLYYRNMNCIGDLQVENFAPQIVDGKYYYSAFAELHKDFRNFNGGFSSGMYLLMDENFNEIDQVTMQPNQDPNHTHGEGYLDQHEFVMIDEGHYLTLSYTPILADNLPETVEGLDGGNTAYVWAGIIQEVQDGNVISEINTADYPLLYESAVEKIDYANSTDQGVPAENRKGEEAISPADGWMDYVHVNSIDYTLDADGTADKILVSMRDQSAVYQFDIDTGAMEWIMGGKASTLSGYEDYTTTRADDNGNEFQALTFGQHYARYTNKAEDGTISGNTEISVFDNQTGSAPFLTAAEIPTLTRVFKATIDTNAGTATISDVINGTDLNEKTDKYHIASHCGSVQYDSDSSVTIGWGLHGVIDNIGAMAPEGTMGDKGYEDLRQGSRPIFTDYNPADDTVSFELSTTRNPKEQNEEAMFSYRTYKTAE